MVQRLSHILNKVIDLTLGIHLIIYVKVKLGTLNEGLVLGCESLLEVWHEEGIVRFAKETHAYVSVALYHYLAERNYLGLILWLTCLISLVYSMRDAINGLLHLFFFYDCESVHDSILARNRLLKLLFVVL